MMKNESVLCFLPITQHLLSQIQSGTIHEHLQNLSDTFKYVYLVNVDCNSMSEFVDSVEVRASLIANGFSNVLVIGNTPYHIDTFGTPNIKHLQTSLDAQYLAFQLSKGRMVISDMAMPIGVIRIDGLDEDAQVYNQQEDAVVTNGVVHEEEYYSLQDEIARIKASINRIVENEENSMISHIEKMVSKTNRFITNFFKK